MIMKSSSSTGIVMLKVLSSRRSKSARRSRSSTRLLSSSKRLSTVANLAGADTATACGSGGRDSADRGDDIWSGGESRAEWESAAPAGATVTASEHAAAIKKATACRPTSAGGRARELQEGGATCATSTPRPDAASPSLRRGTTTGCTATWPTPWPFRSVAEAGRAAAPTTARLRRRLPTAEVGAARDTRKPLRMSIGAALAEATDGTNFVLHVVPL